MAGSNNGRLRSKANAELLLHGPPDVAQNKTSQTETDYLWYGSTYIKCGEQNRQNESIGREVRRVVAFGDKERGRQEASVVPRCSLLSSRWGGCGYQMHEDTCIYCLHILSSEKKVCRLPK